MLIDVPYPHMVLNSHNSLGDYQMLNTWKVSAGESVEHMMNWIATIASNAPGGQLETLIFNCHGGGAYLEVGNGIRLGDTSQFSKLNGLVSRIWFASCSVAYVGYEEKENGNLFCSEIAIASGASVTASTENQNIGIWEFLGFPYGCIDEWEGEVYTFKPDGSSFRHTNFFAM